MQSTNINYLSNQLQTIIENHIHTAIMIWGAPGIGKSSLVHSIGQRNKLEIIDLRISQLAPTDLRGLPEISEGVSKWCPPEFLPQSGKGILFLDEFNMATPAVMGIAQQLILDRRVGNYQVPDGWFIWAAGNTAKDKAAVYQMPQPLANRFLHFSIHASIESFRAYGILNGINPMVLAFLSMRPELLHKPNSDHAWPSPRSWEFASQLMNADLDIDAAVGTAAAVEFEAFMEIQSSLPDISAIVNGEGEGIPFPSEISKKFALTTSLTSHMHSADQAFHAMKWMVEVADKEFAVLFNQDVKTWLSLIDSQLKKEFIQNLTKSSDFKKLFADLLQQNSTIQQQFQ